MDANVEVQFELTLNQKEFSLITRLLAGHALRDDEHALRFELNKRLLELRVHGLKTYIKQSEQALANAIAESS